MSTDLVDQHLTQENAFLEKQNLELTNRNDQLLERVSQLEVENRRLREWKPSHPSLTGATEGDLPCVCCDRMIAYPGLCVDCIDLCSGYDVRISSIDLPDEAPITTRVWVRELVEIPRVLTEKMRKSQLFQQVTFTFDVANLAGTIADQAGVAFARFTVTPLTQSLGEQR